MPPGDEIELDARLAWVLDVGLEKPSWFAHGGGGPGIGVALVDRRQAREMKPEYKRYKREIKRLRELARAGARVSVDRADLAQAAAALGGLRKPSRHETIDVLVALVQEIQHAAWFNGPVFLIGGLEDIGWPLGDPESHLVEHLIAAADLGVLDAPVLPNPSSDPLGPVIHQGPPPPPAERSRRPPGSPPAGTLGDLLLEEWEHTLGSIVDEIAGALFREGYIQRFG